MGLHLWSVIVGLHLCRVVYLSTGRSVITGLCLRVVCHQGGLSLWGCVAAEWSSSHQGGLSLQGLFQLSSLTPSGRSVVVGLCLNQVVYLLSGRSVVVGLCLSRVVYLSSGRSVVTGFRCTSVAEGNDNETGGHRDDGIGQILTALPFMT